MTLRELCCLCAVVDAGFNISRAAAALHATQPAISKQLRQLEDELGLDLILRQAGRPVALTVAGEAVVLWARKALQCTGNIHQIARDCRHDPSGSIDIVTTHEHAKYLLLDSIVAFRRLHPKLQINIVQGHPDRVPNLMRSGRVSIGVCPLPPEIPKDVICLPFETSPRILIAPTGHPVFDEANLTLEQLAAYPIVIQHSVRREGAKIIQRFQEAGLSVQVVVQALDADVNKAYVAAGMGVGIIPSFTFCRKTDLNLQSMEIGHLFEDAISCVLLRRESQLERWMYEFLELLHPELTEERLRNLSLEEARSSGSESATC